MVYAAQPREGTETRFRHQDHMCTVDLWGLCSSTPRGDGNPAKGAFPLTINSIEVYAAQPREGTETITIFGSCRRVDRDWFMQLNPARGRKLQIDFVHNNSFL